MRKLAKKMVKNEDGQVLVIFALLLVVFIGFAALVIDVGMMYRTKSKMQIAADAAALAGAQDLPSASLAISAAMNFAEANGAEKSKTTVITPYKGDPNKIEVESTQNVQYSFARVLGFTDADISARAVAQNTKWAGDALPFINLDGLGETSPKGEPVFAWNKVHPGDKERIDNSDLVINTNRIQVKYTDGFITSKKGKDLSDIQNPLKNIVVAGKTVYIISVKHEEMPNYAKKGSKELKNGDLIPVADTVLLECQVKVGWNGTGSDDIALIFINSYNWDDTKKTYLSATGESPGGPPKLVE